MQINAQRSTEVTKIENDTGFKIYPDTFSVVVYKETWSGLRVDCGTNNTIC